MSADAISRPTFTNEAPWWRVVPERLTQMTRLYGNWPVALADRVGFLRSGRTRKYRVRLSPDRWIELLTRGNGFDIRAINELYIGRVYDKWYNGNIPSEAVIDIGANCGYFSVLAGALFQPTHLVCIEPDPSNRSMLERNLALNDLSAEIVPAALVHGVEQKGTVILHRSEDPRLHTVLEPDAVQSVGITKRGRTVGSITVMARTLDDVIGQSLPADSRISFLKVDVEGCEWDLLSSFSASGWSRVDHAVIESDIRMPEELRERIHELGFSLSCDFPFWALHRG